jgi:hypothetical protein
MRSGSVGRYSRSGREKRSLSRGYESACRSIQESSRLMRWSLVCGNGRGITSINGDKRRSMYMNMKRFKVWMMGKEVSSLFSGVLDVGPNNRLRFGKGETAL